MRIAALTATESHLYAGTLSGHLHSWPLTQIKAEIQKPIRNQDDTDCIDELHSIA